MSPCGRASGHDGSQTLGPPDCVRRLSTPESRGPWSSGRAEALCHGCVHSADHPPSSLKVARPTSTPYPFPDKTSISPPDTNVRSESPSRGGPYLLTNTHPLPSSESDGLRPSRGPQPTPAGHVLPSTWDRLYGGLRHRYTVKSTPGPWNNSPPHKDQHQRTQTLLCHCPYP